MRAFRHLVAIVIALLLVTVIGMAGFHYIEGWSWFDGLYMVITTFRQSDIRKFIRSRTLGACSMRC